MTRTSPGKRLGVWAGENVTRVLILVFRGVVKLPYPVVRRIGEALGELAWQLARKRRRITLTNLRLCFPGWSEERRLAVARGHFHTFLRSVVDRFIYWFEPADRIRELTRLEGEEHFLAQLGRPMIFLAPHFAGMDAGGMRFQLDRRGVSMYAQLKNRVMNAAMVHGRERFGTATMVLRNEGLRPAIRLMREGVPFYFLPDMDLGPRDAIFVPFFGVPAATVTSVARLVQMTGAVVIPFVTRMTDDGYVARWYPAWQDFPGDDLEAAVRRMNAFIEERVLEMPEQYLWSHKRFKTRPPGVPSVYT